MSTMAGGPSSPTARNGVDGLLIKSSISETLGRRISIEGLRLYGTHTNHKLPSERHKWKTKESIERKIERFDVRFMDTFAFRSSFDAREKKKSATTHWTVKMYLHSQWIKTLELKPKIKTFSCIIYLQIENLFRSKITQKYKKSCKKASTKRKTTRIEMNFPFDLIDQTIHVTFSPQKCFSCFVMCQKKKKMFSPSFLFDHDV